MSGLLPEMLVAFIDLSPRSSIVDTNNGLQILSTPNPKPFYRYVDLTIIIRLTVGDHECAWQRMNGSCDELSPPEPLKMVEDTPTHRVNTSLGKP